MASTLDAERLSLRVGDENVSASLSCPAGARACCVLAHGAGAGMHHPFMAEVTHGLAARGVATLRFQFPFMERGSRRPDPPAVCHATVRAAVALAAQRSSLPLVAGGKSFGGRMTSQTQALEPLPGVRALVFLGFPLHPAGKPSIARADHLDHVRVPMLFVQGTKDKLATPRLLTAVAARLGDGVTLMFAAQADHSLHAPKRAGTTDAATLAGLLDRMVPWIDRHCVGAPASPGG